MIDFLLNTTITLGLVAAVFGLLELLYYMFVRYVELGKGFNEEEEED